MEAKVYTEMRALFTEYLTEKKLRKTEERYAIFKEICAFPGHFDMCMLSDRLEQDNFHVSKAHSIIRWMYWLMPVWWCVIK